MDRTGQAWEMAGCVVAVVATTEEERGARHRLLLLDDHAGGGAGTELVMVEGDEAPWELTFRKAGVGAKTKHPHKSS